MENKFNCEVCNKNFNRKNQLNRHMITHSEGQEFERVVYGPTFKPSLTIRTKVVRNHSEGKLYECQICKKKFAANNHLEKHSIAHLEEKLYECQICKKKFAANNHLEQHSIVHLEEKLYECQICKKKFAAKKDLEQHRIVHLKKKKYECQICKKKFAAKKALGQHSIAHFKKKKYECQLCKKKFASKKDLELHYIAHLEGNLYECQICKKKFAARKYLDKHSVAHLEEKLYECQICKQIFSKECYLNQHQKSLHSGPPYECHVCKIKFLEERGLIIHMDVHPQRKYFTCSKYPKEFSKRNQSREHMKIHENDIKKESVMEVECNVKQELDGEKYNRVEIEEDPLSYSQYCIRGTGQLTEEKGPFFTPLMCDIDKVKIEPVEWHEPEEDPLGFAAGKCDTTQVEEKIGSWIKCDNKDGIKKEFKDH